MSEAPLRHRPEIPADLRGDLPALRDLAIDLAVGAGELVRTGRANAVTEQVGTKTTRTDVVTVMDRASEDYLRRRLAKERPGDLVLGEEAGVGETRGSQSRRSRSARSVTWVVDPIDGTVNYLYGRPEYAVSVAAVVGDPTVAGAWRPVAGAVVNPASGQLYHAYDDGGAALRDAAGEQALRVNDVAERGWPCSPPDSATPRSVRREQALALLDILPAVRDIRRGGSAALDLCAVASGVVDAYAERGVHVWDIAAGWLIAAEAGAHVAAWESGPNRPPGLLAAGPSLAGPLLAAVQDAYRRAAATGHVR